jgi:hypothetical protein
MQAKGFTKKNETMSFLPPVLAKGIGKYFIGE